MLTRRRFAGSLAASALTPGLVAGRARAEAWPNRPVRFLCPVAPGGSIDAVARLIAGRLGEIWQQQIVVENRSGNINIGAEAAARAEPDGYTIFTGPSSLAVTRFLSPPLSYDPVGDFAPVSLVGVWPNIMVVPVSSPAHSVMDFIAYARAHPGKVTYASGGHGSSLHLAAELFKQLAKIDMAHVPYRGAAPAFNDLIPGRVDVMFNLVTSSLPLVRSGQVRALAIASSQRIAVLPDLPTIAESGVPGYDMTAWIGLFVPARTPGEIARKINADTVAAIADPATRKKLESMGVVPVGSTPEELAQQVRTDQERWEPVIRQAGISMRD